MRLAKLSDLSEINRLYHLFREESGYIANNPNDAKIWNFIYTALTNEDFCVLVCGEEKLTGFLIGQVVESHVCDDVLAIEHAWFIQKEYRRGRDGLKLIQAYEYWAKEIKKADHINLSCLPPVKDLGPFFKKIGYNQAESTYHKRIL